MLECVSRCDVPARTSDISPGGASLINSAAAESFWAFEAIVPPGLDSIVLVGDALRMADSASKFNVL